MGRSAPPVDSGSRPGKRAARVMEPDHRPLAGDSAVRDHSERNVLRRRRAPEILLSLLLLVLSSLAGCSKPPPSSQKAVDQETSLLIGLIPEQNIFRQVERYEPLSEYLSGKIGARIELKILPRYGNIVDNFRSSGLDGAFFGSFTYALAHAKLGVSVIARPLALDNTSTYHGLIFVRKDSGIRTVADMRGKRFAFVDKATTAGYLLPLEFFHEHGVKDFHTYFRETYFAGTHEDAILDVLNGKADVGAAKNTVFQRLAKSDGRVLTDLAILKRSPDVPENALALKPDIDETTKRSISAALLSMHEDPEGKKILKLFGAVRFIPTSDRDYEPVFRYAREIHLDLAKYDYVNE